MTVIWKKKAQNVQQEKNPNQMEFLFDQKQLSLPITPHTPVHNPPAPEPAPQTPFYPEGQALLPGTQKIQCKAPGCQNTTFSPDKDPTFTIDPSDQKAYCNEHFNKCSSCDEYFYTNHLAKSDMDGEIYCTTCMPEESLVVCPHCDAKVEPEEILLPTRRNTYSMKQGGCTECAEKCNHCARVIDKEEGNYVEDGDSYCEDCHSNLFSYCESCEQSYPQDSVRYVDSEGSYCDSCYEDKFFMCYHCNEDTEKNDQHEFANHDYCGDCYQKVAVGPFEKFTNNFEAFGYTPKDKAIDELEDLLPISVKDLRAKSTALANSLKELIQFANGKTLTQEIVDKYRESLGIEEYPVSYSAWDGLQRSVDSEVSAEYLPAQLVLNIQASPEMLGRLKANPALFDLFTRINDLSQRSGHPFAKNQVGWARLELDPKGDFILVDEIQTDHSNAAYKLKHGRGGEILKVRDALVNKYNLNNDSLNKLLDSLNDAVKDFPNIAIQAISQFARNNDFKKLYWHTYESGKKLKDNEPPRSLYEKTPKENYFKPTQEKPFGLDGEFFSRRAEDATLSLCRKFMLKHAGKL